MSMGWRLSIRIRMPFFGRTVTSFNRHNLLLRLQQQLASLQQDREDQPGLHHREAIADADARPGITAALS